MNFKDGIFRTTLISIVEGTEFAIHLESDIVNQKQLLVETFNFIRNIKNDNISSIVKNFWDVMYRLDILSNNFNNCELVFSINNKEMEMNIVGL